MVMSLAPATLVKAAIQMKAVVAINISAETVAICPRASANRSPDAMGRRCPMVLLTTSTHGGIRAGLHHATFLNTSWGSLRPTLLRTIGRDPLPSRRALLPKEPHTASLVLQISSASMYAMTAERLHLTRDCIGKQHIDLVRQRYH